MVAQPLERRPSLKARLRGVWAWLADWQILLVALIAPVFMLADRLPPKVVALAVLAVLPIWGLYRLGRGHFFRPTPVDLPLLLLMLTLPVGVWAAAQPERALPLLLQYLFALTLFYALVNSLTTAHKVEWAGGGVLVLTALFTALSLVGTAWSSGSKFIPVDLASRMPHLLSSVWYSAGFNANIVGGTLALFVPVTAAYALAASTWPLRLFLGLLLLVEAFTLVITQSRGALLGFGLALAVVAIAHNRRWAWAVPVVVILAAVGVGLYGVQPSLDFIMQNAGDSAIQSGEGRLELFSRGLYMLQDFAFTGVGLGMFPRVLPLLYPLFLVGPDTVVPHVHNVYLQMGIDHGLPGLVAYLALLLLLASMGLRAIRLSRGQSWRPLAIGLLGGLAAYLVHGLVDAIWHTPRSHPIIWAAWGLLAAVWCWTNRLQPAENEA